MSDALVMEVIRKTVTVDCAIEEAFRDLHRGRNQLVAGRDALDSRVGGRDRLRAEGRWRRLRDRNERRARALGDGARVGAAPQSRPRVEHPRAGRRADRGRGAVPAGGHATRVELEHRGWENVELDGPAKRGNYDTGWDAVLGRVRRSRLDTDVDRRSRAARAGSAHGREPEGGEGRTRPPPPPAPARPPPDRGHELRVQLCPGQVRSRVSARRANEVVALDLAVPVSELEEMPPRPHAGPEVEALESCLLGELAAQSSLVGLPFVHAAARHRPPRPVRKLEADEEHAVIRIEHDCANGFADPELSHRASLAAPKTSEAARPTGRRRSPVTWTEGRERARPAPGVGDRRVGQAASGSRASSRSSRSIRSRSPTSLASPRPGLTAREHFHGVLVVAPAVAALVALRLAERPEPLHSLAG